MNVCKRQFFRLMLSAVVVMALSGCDDSEDQGNGSDDVHISSMHIQLNYTQAPGSFSRHYTGTCTLVFDPAPPEDLVVFCVLNSGSIQGTQATHGQKTVIVPMEGNAVSDVFAINPSRLDVFDKSTMIKIAMFDFYWD